MADTSTDGDLDAMGDLQRLRALAGTGPSDAPDDGMQFIARWTRRAPGVPLAVVSLIQADHQIVPGPSAEPGLPSFSRAAVPSWEVCRRVVATGGPVVITAPGPDAATRTHPDAGPGSSLRPSQRLLLGRRTGRRPRLPPWFTLFLI
ncbi:hypothetical protein [Pseudonocardia endophytica]|uniref:Uncharacterized protein n=1 Tax=Pseudonocardia endophytica TaxID=401976 RepID=A0A4R1HWL5_PSEEN|nr:hypothetical protein [Pseudonocardia endophytica]TCK26738.1 hypothetical protein EV378_2583 [Pseudonocardia endophytica]